jgi:hypothetical protein
VVDVKRLPPHIQEKVYRPAAGEEYDVEIEIPRGADTLGGKRSVIDRIRPRPQKNYMEIDLNGDEVT